MPACRFMQVRALLISGVCMLLGTVLSFEALASSPTDRDSRTFGKEQLAVFELDATNLARLRAHKADALDPKRSPAENMALASTTDWVGPVQKLGTAKNPYVLVVTLTGTAIADGDAVSAWQAGWKTDDGMTRANPLAGLNRLKARAGERFTVTVSSTPLSFKEDRSVQPVLGLVRTANMNIENVQVQVWSGLPGRSALQVFFSLPVLMLGLAMFALWWFLRRRV